MSKEKIIGIIVALIVVVGAWYFFFSGDTNVAPATTPETSEQNFETLPE